MFALFASGHKSGIVDESALQRSRGRLFPSSTGFVARIADETRLLIGVRLGLLRLDY